MTVKDSMAYVFMDGNMYSATSVNDITRPNGVRPIIKGTSGYLTIGDRVSNSNGYVTIYVRCSASPTY